MKCVCGKLIAKLFDIWYLTNDASKTKGTDACSMFVIPPNDTLYSRFSHHIKSSLINFQLRFKSSKWKDDNDGRCYLLRHKYIAFISIRRKSDWVDLLDSLHKINWIRTLNRSFDHLYRRPIHLCIYWKRRKCRNYRKVELSSLSSIFTGWINNFNKTFALQPSRMLSAWILRDAWHSESHVMRKSCRAVHWISYLIVNRSLLNALLIWI